jgi:signal transduction histidine kinase
LVLAAIERGGLGGATLDGLVSFGLVLFIGVASGALAGRARAEAARSRLLLEVQSALAGGGTLGPVLERVAERLRAALGARAVAIVAAASDAPPLVVRSGGDAGRCTFAADSAAGWVLGAGRSLFISDLEGDPRFGLPRLGPGRPRRLLLVPLCGGGESNGVLAVERRGEFPRELRALVEALALHLALGIENRRLAERQRRFAEELEEKVAGATERLRELDRAKSDLVSIVSHELRTPLTSIQGFSELLLTRRLPAERARRFVESIHREAERLGRIVGDLLDLARIERGRESPLRRVPVALGPVLEANAELFEAQGGRHVIRRDIPLSLPPALADRDAVDRIVKNLLSNAVRYSPRGGEIRLWARPCTEDPARVEIGVEDQGVGIPAEALPRIFETYSRVPHPETGHVPGLGLGLALVKSLVEAQGGTVSVQSEPGRGSSFVVTLPVAAPAAKA